MLKIEAISSFLSKRARPDMAALYKPEMEVQIQVARDDGEPVEGTYKGKLWKAWSDGLTTWKSFRIPFNSKSEPTYEDSELRFDLFAHAEGIGLTGYNWRNRLSEWVGFDFDSLYGHSNGLSDHELEEIIDVVRKAPYVTLRRSTSGKGLHLYVEFANPVPTANHTEHAALARAVLNDLSMHLGLKLDMKVDVCGGVMWFWHRKYELNKERGFKLLQSGSAYHDIPRNWKDHLAVVRRQRTKVKKDDNIEKVAARYASLPLSEAHQELLKYLGNAASWDSDHNMLITHTAKLKEAHKTLDFEGVFETVATGKEDGDINCFCFPLPEGAWVVRRYGQKCKEASTWQLDAGGWTRCFLNRKPDFNIACQMYSGMESSKGMEFHKGYDANSALVAMGLVDAIPPGAYDRLVRMSCEKMPGSVLSRIKIEIERTKEERPGNDFKDWIARPKYWERTFSAALPLDIVEIQNYDDIIRHTISEGMDAIGWKTNIDNQGWVTQPAENARLILAAQGHKPADSTFILGNCVTQPWKMVTKPFQPEYPGGREWNVNAPQLRHTPTQKDEPQHPHWDLILRHIGTNLYLGDNKWCVKNNIVKGEEYLLLWLASVIQKPHTPLPYLFLFGPQNCGKTILHEAANLLVTRGVQRADKAIEDKFNAEIEGAIICVIEETDLSRSKQAYNKIKDYVTSIMIQIRKMYECAYLARNTTHWIQTANEREACPVQFGDSRITVVRVDSLVDNSEIPRDKLLVRLELEAADFTQTLLSVELPEPDGRLGIPVIETGDKTEAMELAKSPVEQFITNEMTECIGNLIEFDALYGRFTTWVGNSGAWNKNAFSRQWPSSVYPKGKKNLITYVGNVRFNDQEGMTGTKITMDTSGKLLGGVK